MPHSLLVNLTIRNFLRGWKGPYALHLTLESCDLTLMAATMWRHPIITELKSLFPSHHITEQDILSALVIERTILARRYQENSNHAA